MDQSYTSTHSATESRASSKGSPRSTSTVAVEDLLTIDRRTKTAKAKTSKHSDSRGFWGRRTEIEIPEYWTGPGW
jgi:hypothetical protein